MSFINHLMKTEYYYPEESLCYIQHTLADCIQSGELIQEDGGQFSGIESEIYLYAGDIYCFCYQDKEIIAMTKKPHDN